MKLRNIQFLLIIGILVIGCKKDDTSSHTVSGNLKVNGTALANASVTLDGLEQYKTTTNADGAFEIKNVPSGNHNMKAKRSYDSGIYIQKSFDIEVNDADLNLNSILLPNPVSITSIQLDSVTNMATITWNKSYADDFREYKLYSHSSSGLDESTGTLEHVTIDVNDTTKTIQLNNSVNVFFRVFVMNEYGQLGGSNIESIGSTNINLIHGGSFENISDLTNFTFTGDISIDNTTFYNGSGSLHSYVNFVLADNGMYNYSTNEITTPIALETNKDYVLSFWYKAEGVAYMMYPIEFFYNQNNTDKIRNTVDALDWAGEWVPQSPFKILDGTGWVYFSKNFNSDSDANAIFHLNCAVEHVWIDDLQIKVVE